MQRTFKLLLPAALTLGLGTALPAGAESLRLSLGDSIQAALAYSPELKSAGFDLDAASAQASSARAALLPRIGLDGHYDYIAQIIPPVTLPSQYAATFGLDQLDFGFHNEYSVGVSANWDIFSAYSDWKQAQSAVRQREAARAQLDQAKQDLVLKVRLAYFQTQLFETQVRLYAEALKLSQSQLHDLDLRLRAGTSSRIDWLAASNDELEKRAAFRLAQTDLAGALRNLFVLTGQDQDVDVSLPVDGADVRALPARVQRASVAVTLDETADLLAELDSAKDAPFRPQAVARLRALWEQVQAAEKAVDGAVASAYLPSGSVGFRWSYDYPEAPLPQAVDQQTTSAQFSLPLFSFGQGQGLVDAAKGRAESQREAAEDAVNMTKADWQEGHDRLAGLGVQRDLQEQELKQARELRAMVYRSYKIGGSTFLEVQTRSLDALTAGLALAQTETNMLIELANLSALTDASAQDQ